MANELTKHQIARETARALSLVDQVGQVTVTERGVRRWDITPHRVARADRLAALPGYTPPAATPLPWPERGIGPKRTTEEAAQILDQLRRTCCLAGPAGNRSYNQLPRPLPRQG